MSNKHKRHIPSIPNQAARTPNTTQPVPTPAPLSFLDAMVDGREFESLLKFKNVTVNFAAEIRASLKEIANIRQRPVIVYVSNIVNQNIKAQIAIDYSDDLPFTELVNTIPGDFKNIDIILVTPGGSGTQVAKFVDKLRPRFDHVTFILPNMCMSAGTMFALAGDDLIMSNNSHIGPIDPQVLSREGRYVPAQSIITLIDEIKLRGTAAMKAGGQPDWTDLQILRLIDPKDIGAAINASKYSVEIVANYLENYKFKTWSHHSSTGAPVTPKERKQRAEEIANQLCDHGLWKSHGRGITREEAEATCRLKITHAESIPGLDRAIKRFWALCYWAFENTPIYKTFVSEYYALFRNDKTLIPQTK